ncbi:hypothetical protein [Catenibacterium sp.]|jgi:hypothetical protein|uniref:hypothetical protein n=1 Tax=Catenibacterium sp. TaxID=2049022 RepID=UPI003FD6D7D2
MDVVGSITGFFRSILWAIIYLLLWVTDTIWQVVMKIATLDFFEKGNVAEWFTAISGIIIMFVVFRVVKIMVKFMTSEEYRTRLDPIHLIFMIGVASFSIAFAPIGYQYLNNVAITSVKEMSNFAPSDAGINNSRNAKISDILVEASSINLTGDSETGSLDQQIKQLDKDIARYQKEIEQAEAEKKKSQPGDATWNGANQVITKNNELIKEAKATKKELQKKKNGVDIYDSNGFDINAEDSDGNYMYFSSWTSLFFMIGVAFLGFRTFLGVALSIGKRSILICIQYLLAPYAIASLIDSESKDFETWVRMIAGNFMINFVQIYGCYFVLYMINSNIIQSALGGDMVGILAKIILLIAGFMAIENIPSYVGRILGGSSSTVGQAWNEAQGVGRMGLSAGSFATGAMLGSVGTVASMVGGGIAGFSSTQGAGARTLATASGIASGVARSASAVSTGMKGRRSSASIGAGIISKGSRALGQSIVGAGELSDTQIAEAESAGMDTSGMNREEYDAGSQAFGIEQGNVSAEEQVRNENSNPARSAGQQAYNDQAQQRLGSKKSQHTAGNVNAQIRNQRIVDDAVNNNRKER